MFKIKKYAFTLAEILMALLIIGVLITITIVTLFQIENSEKVRKTKSWTLFSSLETIYQSLLATKTSQKFSLSNLEDINNDGDIDAKDIRDFITSSYMGENLNSCSDFTVADGFDISQLDDTTSDDTTSDVKTLKVPAFISDDTACADLYSLAYIAVNFDKTCSLDPIRAQETPDSEVRLEENICGYVAYIFKDTSGVFGKDFFIYPLKKNTKKTKTTVSTDTSN